MRDDPLLARLAAANPVPTEANLHEPEPLRLLQPGRTILLLAICVAVAVPTAAFARDIGTVFGLTNQGTPVATSSLSRDTSLAMAMQEFGFPTTLQLLGDRDGMNFYAAQKAGGYCFAVLQASTPAGSQRPASDVGCDGAFPSAQVPVSLFPVAGRFAGFAADGVATVVLTNTSGATLAAAEVSNNLFVGGAMPSGPIVVKALDAEGHVLATLGETH
jgi:hypothetical protein